MEKVTKVGAVMAVGLLAIVFSSISLNAEGQCAGYPDVDGDSGYCEAITYAQDLEVITGQGNGNFGYGGILNRAEAAAIIVRYLQIEEPTSRAQSAKFVDLAQEDWYSGYFEALIQRGIFKGYPDQTMRPEGTLNKAEWLALWYRTVGLTGSNTEANVADVGTDSSTAWFRSYLNAAVQNDLIDLEGNRFQPASGQKRELVADLIYRTPESTSGGGAVVVGGVDQAGIYSSKFGVQATQAQLQTIPDLAIGFWLPVDIEVNWSGGNVDLSGLDQFVLAAQDRGVAGVVKVNNSGGSGEQFADFVETLVERYDADGQDDLADLELPMQYWWFTGEQGDAESVLNQNLDSYVLFADANLTTVAAGQAVIKTYQDVLTGMVANSDFIVFDLTSNPYGARTDRSYDALITIIDYLDRYTAVSGSGERYQVTALGTVVNVVMSGSIPADLQSMVGVSAVGVHLLDSDFDKSVSEPVLLWNP